MMCVTACVMSSHTLASRNTGDPSLRTITKSRRLSSGFAIVPFTMSSNCTCRRVKRMRAGASRTRSFPASTDSISSFSRTRQSPPALVTSRSRKPARQAA